MSTYLSKISGACGDFFFPFADHQWEIVGGYVAPVQAWLVPAEVAQGVIDGLGSAVGASREVVLTFGDPDTPIEVNRVIVLGTAPADNPQRRYLLLTDVRWYFTRAWFVLDVNVRRRIGDRRLVGNSFIDEIPVDSLAYAPWSINGETAYDWETLKEHVLTYLSFEHHGRPELLYVTDDFSIDVTAKTVQEVTNDSPGHLGLARAIEAIPGAGIYVSLSGWIHVYDRTPGAEKTLVEALPKPLIGHGHLVWTDHSTLRPAPSAHSWRVYVDYEIEVRFDFRTAATDTLATVLSLTSLANVLQVTDQRLEIPAGDWGDARVVGQGTWVTFAEAFAAWGPATMGPLSGPHLTLPQLTSDIVARHWFGDGLQQYTIGGAGGASSFDPIWSARISEVMRCFRTCFRVKPNFWERVRHAWDVRAAVWDPSTGTRAPSPVYSNYHVMPLDRWIPNEIVIYGQDVTDSYSSSGRLDLGRPSGFQAKIVDEELGIIEIVRSISRFPGHSRIAVSDVDPDSKADIAATDGDLREAVLQKLRPERSYPDQPDGWSLATILSCAPAAPNDLRRMYEIPVSMKDAAATAGLHITPNGNGPDQELRSQLAEARVPWTDDDPIPSQIVLTMLGAVEDGNASIRPPEDPPPDFALIPINLNQELIPLAKAVAAADLMTKLDHYQGSQIVPMSSDIVPIGSIDRVTHKVTENRAVTVVHATPQPAPFRAVDFLSGSARSYLLKELAARR